MSAESPRSAIVAREYRIERNGRSSTAAGL